MIQLRAPGSYVGGTYNRLIDNEDKYNNTQVSPRWEKMVVRVQELGVQAKLMETVKNAKLSILGRNPRCLGRFTNEEEYLWRIVLHLYNDKNFFSLVHLYHTTFESMQELRKERAMEQSFVKHILTVNIICIIFIHYFYHFAIIIQSCVSIIVHKYSGNVPIPYIFAWALQQQ